MRQKKCVFFSLHLTFETNGSRMNRCTKKCRANTCRWTNKNQLNVLICETFHSQRQQKKYHKNLSILQTWCVCTVHKCDGYFSSCNRCTLYFFILFILLCVRFCAANCSGIPSITEKCVPHVQATFRCVELHALQCILFIYFFRIGELWKPFNWSTYIQFEGCDGKKRLLSTQNQAKNEKQNDHYAFITMQRNTLKYSSNCYKEPVHCVHWVVIRTEKKRIVFLFRTWSITWGKICRKKTLNKVVAVLVLWCTVCNLNLKYSKRIHYA